MADKNIYGAAENGTYSTSSPNPHVDLAGTSPTGFLIAQLFGGALTNGQTATVTIAKASDAGVWAVYSGATYTTATPNIIDLTAATLKESSGSLANSDSVVVLGLVPDAGAALTHDAQTITTADVTGAVNKHYRCTIAGLTADRYITLPAGAVGDRIIISIVDGDDTYKLGIKGATDITIDGGAAATLDRWVQTKGTSVSYEATSATNWQCIDGNAFAKYTMQGKATATTTTDHYSGTTLTIPLDGRIYDFDFPAENITIAFSGAPTAPVCADTVLNLKQRTSSTMYGITAWPSGIKWPYGIPQTMPQTLSARMRVVISTSPSGIIDVSAMWMGV